MGAVLVVEIHDTNVKRLKPSDARGVRFEVDHEGTTY